MGDAVAQHAAGRDRAGLPGHLPVRGHQPSEGRGTTRPFELIGAPWVDHRWAEALNELGLPGVEFREAYFAPTFSKHAGEACAGVQLHVADRDDFDAIRTAIAMIVTGRQLYPDDWAWRETAAPYWIDKLSGNDQVRLAIDGGADVDEVVGRLARTSWPSSAGLRARHLLYPGRRP